jgi:hypothetical protein
MLHFIKIRPVGAEFFRADGRTDMTKLMVALRNFANAPKNGLYSERKNWSSYIQGTYDWEGRAKNSQLDPKERICLTKGHCQGE